MERGEQINNCCQPRAWRLYLAELISCLLGVRWIRAMLWNRPAKWPMWWWSATRTSTTRVMSVRKRTQPQRWASQQQQVPNHPHFKVILLVILLLSVVSLTCACQRVYKWRVDLSKSEKYWDGWFRGTSNLFLACNLPKLLLLAGKDSSLVRFHRQPP